MKKLKLMSKILTPVLGLLLLSGCGQSTANTLDTNASNTAYEQQLDTNGSQVDENSKNDVTVTAINTSNITSTFDLKNVPEFSGKPYVAINNNVPYFTDSDYTTTSFEKYSDLDSLGRCGVAYANVGKDIMPTEERGSIGQVKPTGWHTVKYDNVDGKYLYNRCHLIGYQLTGENANEKNLITGTRYLNIQGMLPFENMIADYVKETGNHVLYRVTPIFDGNNLVASGVLMEAKSVEDKGAGVSFNVYAYNVQPDVTINYADGSSSGPAAIASSSSSSSASSSSASSSSKPKSETSSSSSSSSKPKNEASSSSNQTVSNAAYVLNTDSHKFHRPSCASAKRISDANRENFNGTRDQVISRGYDPCMKCNP